MNTPTPTAYPLQWPAGWPRTDAARRENGRFKTSIPAALSNLQKQIGLMGGKGVILSSNYTLGITNPKDPGVVAYFTWQDTSIAIPCDRWTRIEQNVQAIALTIEAMRGMERWGAKHMIKAMFTGFKQLPAGDTEWWKVLGVSPRATQEEVRTAYRALAKTHHPDAGGNPDEFHRIQSAYEMAEGRRT